MQGRGRPVASHTAAVANVAKVAAAVVKCIVANIVVVAAAATVGSVLLYLLLK